MFSEKNEREREGGLEWVDKVEENVWSWTNLKDDG